MLRSTGVSEFRRHGGYHPTFLPDESLQFADAVVVGDAEGIWPQVVEDARNGRLRRLYQQNEFPSLSGSDPDRSIFKGKRYAPLTLVQYGRGCKYNCNFCSIRAFYGTHFGNDLCRKWWLRFDVSEAEWSFWLMTNCLSTSQRRLSYSNADPAEDQLVVSDLHRHRSGSISCEVDAEERLHQRVDRI